MHVHRPPEILPARLGDHLGGVRAVHRDVVFEAVVADKLHQLLKSRDVGDGAVAEGFELVVGRGALADVTADDPGGVVGGEVVAALSSDRLRSARQDGRASQART